MVPSSRMGRYFNSSITFTCIIRRCDGNCSKVYSSRNDRSIKFRLHIISKSKREFIHACTIWTCIKKCTYTNYYNYCTNVSGILTGTLTIENIFGVPGLGDQFVRSITTNDFSVIMATTILFSTLFIVSIFIVDILYGIIDPRIRVQGGKK